MPTIMRVLKLLWIIHTDDHNPPHVEVYYGNPKNYEAWAKVRIDKIEILESEGFSTQALDRILRVAQSRQKFLSSKWRKYHGK